MEKSKILTYILIGLGILLILAFVFSSKFRFIVVGIAVIVGLFWVGSKVKDKKVKNILFIIAGVGAVVFLVIAGVSQTIRSVSNYEDNSGDRHWLVNGVADSVDEGFTFRSLPTSIELNDGTKITPKEEAVLYVSKKESSCEYQLNKITNPIKITTLFGLITLFEADLEYYQLLAGERTALVSVRDDSGNERIIDGTLTQKISFYDNGGTLTFKSLGILSSKRSCESASNVAIIFDNEGSPSIVEKNDLERAIGTLGDQRFSAFTILDLYNFINTEVDENVNFLSIFNDYEIDSKNKFIGEVDLGSAEFVIDADQDYYDSFVYTPPKPVRPKVTLNAPSEQEQDESYSVKAIITNSEDSQGNVLVTTGVSSGSIVPSSQNIILGDSKELNFIVKSPDMKTTQRVCVKACSVNENNCDESCRSVSITEEPVIDCGNGVCESFESYTSCPADCRKPAECENDEDCDNNYICEEGFCINKLVCDKFWQEEGIKTTYKINILGIIKLLPQEEPVCKTSDWVYYVLGSLIIIILGSVALVLYSKKGGFKK